MIRAIVTWVPVERFHVDTSHPVARAESRTSGKDVTQYSHSFILLAIYQKKNTTAKADKLFYCFLEFIFKSYAKFDN